MFVACLRVETSDEAHGCVLVRATVEWSRDEQATSQGIMERTRGKPGYHVEELEPRAGWSVEEGSGIQRDTTEGRRRTFFAVALAVGIFAWAVIGLLVEGPGFAVLAPAKVQGVEEAASALARLFAALVLALFLTEDAGRRMRWVAGGLVVLGLGHLIFGYIEPLVQSDPPELHEALYEIFVAQTVACALFAIGLFPGTPPRFLVRAMVVVSGSLVAGYILIFEFMGGEEWMPSLTRVDSPEETVQFGTPFAWLTPLHWTVSVLPLALAIAAMAGAFWQSRRGMLRGWLLFAMVLLAGSVLHEYLWPSAYGGGVLTSADVLGLAFAIVVAVGGLTELRRAASERAELLASERERTRRLRELAALRADFSAMVAHELDGPISAVRRLTEMLSAEGRDPAVRDYATGTIDAELDVLTALVRDVREAAAVERDDFKVRPRPMQVSDLLNEAEAFANTLPGDHPVETTFAGGLEAGERVLADPERVGQVLRNLLSNAAKYSAEGAPIEIRATREDGHVNLQVADRGPGIHPDDRARIFEKFGRGRDGRRVSGAGLGLYLSRRIVRGHGSELTVETTPGEGSTFGFDLKVAR